MEANLMTMRQVADLFGVSMATVSRWADSGELPVIRIGARTVRFRRSDVEKIIAVPSPTTPTEATAS